MELRFGEKEEALRMEVRDFLIKNNGRDGDGGGASLGSRSDEEFEFAKGFNEKLAQRGWIAPAWPKEYGGLGASIYEQMVFNEEFGYWGAPDTGTRGFGVGMIGPTLIIHGNEEQKKHYLPKITSGEHVWCQGYSEPGAGSDLASLQTRAQRDGDEFVINGQKIWTSGGHRANQMFCLVRTDPEAPKHRGISFLLIDDIKNTPGLTIRPLINMANRHHFNEVFFEDVRVPVKNRIGEENRGWYVGTTTLDFERSSIGSAVGVRKQLESLIRQAKSDKGEASFSRNPKVKGEFVDRWIECEVAKMLSYRVVNMQVKNLIPNYEASMCKLFSSELSQRISNLSMHLYGMHGNVRNRASMGYMQAVSSTIAGGTSEVQKGIIATRGLGLPRG